MQTACDKNGWILGYSVNPGNQHDSRTFKSLYDKIKDIGIQTLVADAGYKTPAIAKLLLDDGITPLLPYKRPMTKDGFFKKTEYVYDEYFDCYVCPNDQVLAYHTTNRFGYREYKSCGIVCEGYPANDWDEGSVYATERDRRAPLRNSKRKPWIPLYTDDRKSPDENESRAYVCLHESEKNGKDDSREGKKGKPKVPLITTLPILKSQKSGRLVL